MGRVSGVGECGRESDIPNEEPPAPTVPPQCSPMPALTEQGNLRSVQDCPGSQRRKKREPFLLSGGCRDEACREEKALREAARYPV